MKLVNNALLAANVAMVREAERVMSTIGLSLETALEALTHCSGDSRCCASPPRWAPRRSYSSRPDASSKKTSGPSTRWPSSARSPWALPVLRPRQWEERREPDD